jgi:hypothetical protein
MRLKELLNEDVIISKNIEFAPWHIKDKESLELLFNKQNLSNFSSCKFNKSGTVSIKSNEHFKITENMMLHDRNINGLVLPVQFQNLLCSEFDIVADIISLWGMPSKVTGRINISSGMLKTAEHLNCNINGGIEFNTPELTKFDCNVRTDGLFINRIGFTNFSGWDKFFDVHNYILIGINCVQNFDSKILSLLKMKNLKIINLSTLAKDEHIELDKSCKIVNKHLKSGRDILECQEELIENGYKEFAKL